MSNDYQIVRRVLLRERERREGYYRYRPAERGPAMAEIAGSLAALERMRRELDRMRKASEWRAVGSWWQQKFD